jgi:hypothetical protein
MKEFLRRVYKKNGNIVYRKIADEFIMVPIRNDVSDLSSIYTLNEVGARIWELIDGKREVSKIKKIIIEEFEVDPKEAEADIVELLGQLEAIGGIRIISE